MFKLPASRRDLLAAALTLAAAPPDLWAKPAAGSGSTLGPPLGPPKPFSFDGLKAAAAASARRPYVPPPTLDLSALDYDAARQITYRPGMTLWGDQPGDAAVRFLPMGRYANRPVKVNAVANGQARAVLYSPALFDVAGAGAAHAFAAAPGFSGFKALEPNHIGEWLVFQGASYFRAAGPMHQYGLSARGLAIDTAVAGPESFPDFSEVWLERGPTGDLTVYAQLEGEQVAGAYRIAHSLTPTGLTQTIDCALFFRKSVQRLGVAPLTSMFWYGENEPPAAHDWRPEIHDSDGLAIWTGAGERIWRPLIDPPRVVTNAFADRGPRGFGLLQRDRVFDHYQDDGAFYDRRPSAWVEPLGDWGPGAVQLIEIPTAGETDDNVAAFWTPEAPVRAGDALSFRYRLTWAAEEPAPGVARVMATRTGFGGRPGFTPVSKAKKLVVDFDGPGLAGLTAASGVEAVVTADRGRIESAVAYPVLGTALWRMMIDVTVLGPDSADLRGYLRRGKEALSETWTYQLFNH